MKRTEFTQPWLDALRSGKLEQSRGMYTNNGRYCCLAVGLKFAVKSDKWGDLEDKLGVYEKDARALIDMNDVQGKTFPEIADAIEQMLDVN